MNNEVNNNINNQEQKPVTKKAKKSNPAGLIAVLVGVVILVVILIVVFGLLFKKDNKEDGNKDPKKDPISEKIDVKYNENNGVYEKEGMKLNIFFFDEKEAYFEVASNTNSVHGVAEMKDGKLVYELATTNYTFEFKDKKATLTSSAKEFDGEYKRTGDYSGSDFFTQHYGDEKYLDNYNGEYKDGEKIIRMYQIDASSVRVQFKYEINNSDLVFEIKDENTLYLKFFDDEMTLKLNGDKLEATKKGKNVDLPLEGNYSKTKKLNMKDIFENFSER